MNDGIFYHPLILSRPSHLVQTNFAWWWSHMDNFHFKLLLSWKKLGICIMRMEYWIYYYKQAWLNGYWARNGFYLLCQIQTNNKIELQNLKKNVQLKHEWISLQKNIDVFHGSISLNSPFNENDGLIFHITIINRCIISSHTMHAYLHGNFQL